MSHHSSSTRTSTPFHHARAGSRSGGSRTVLSSPRTSSISSRSSRSSAVSSWIDEVSSRSSSPSPSEWVIPGGTPSYMAMQPPRLLSPPNSSHFLPSPALPSHANSSGRYPPNVAMSYAPPPSDIGSVSSRRSKSSTHTRSSNRSRREQDTHGNSSLRDLDTVPCQICLEPATMCTCVGGEEARLEMRKAACAALSRTSTAGSESGRTHRSHPEESRVASQDGGSVYAQSYGYAEGYGSPVGYAGSAVSAYSYSGQFAVVERYGERYHGSPVTVPMSMQTPSWVNERQGVFGPMWGVHGC